jgi:hypothetical protein
MAGVVVWLGTSFAWGRMKIRVYFTVIHGGCAHAATA